MIGTGVLSADSIAPDRLRVRTWVNDELVQEDTSDALLFPFGQIVADLSQLPNSES